MIQCGTVSRQPLRRTLLPCPPHTQPFREPSRIAWSVYLRVVVEVYVCVPRLPTGRLQTGECLRVCRLIAAPPRLDPVSPLVQLGIRITTGVRLLRPVQPQVDKVSGNLLGIRPAGTIGKDDGDP